jgi:phosphate transport system substrate-binding protein
MKHILMVLTATLAISSLVACTDYTNSITTTYDTSKNITVYTRDTTSGTRDAFFTGIDFTDAISDNSSLVANYVEVDGNGSMITAIANDLYGIGYISLSSLSSSGLTGLAFEGIEASETNVLNGSYELKRPFNYIVRNDWTDMSVEAQIVEAYVAYMSTVDGKSTIKSNGGIISITDTDLLWDDIKSQYPICEQDNSAITIVFGGSTSVEKIAKALSAEFSGKCGNFVAEHNHTGSGDGYKRTQGSEANGTNAIHVGFASRDFKVSEPAAVGTIGLICQDAVVIVINASNDTINNITALTIKAIYQGTLSIWSDLD